MNVLALRTEYAMRGETFSSRDFQWAVLFADEEQGLAAPCYMRTLFVRAVDNPFDVVPCCSPADETVGLR